VISIVDRRPWLKAQKTAILSTQIDHGGCQNIRHRNP